MDVANSVFMFVCTILVFLMTPGLAFFYGGLVDKKNVVGIKLQSFVSIGVTSILWYVVGYSLCFSGDVYGVIGNLDHVFLLGINANDLLPDTGLPVFISEDPLLAIVKGSGLVLEDIKKHVNDGILITV